MFAAQQDLYLGDLVMQSGCPPYGCDGPPNYVFVDPTYKKGDILLPDEYDPVYIGPQIVNDPVPELTESEKISQAKGLEELLKNFKFRGGNIEDRAVPKCGPNQKWVQPDCITAPCNGWCQDITPQTSPAPISETPITPAVKTNPIDAKTVAIALGVGFVVWYLLNNKKD